jgi:hypothetical protein
MSHVSVCPEEYSHISETRVSITDTSDEWLGQRLSAMWECLEELRADVRNLELRRR